MTAADGLTPKRAAAARQAIEAEDNQPELLVPFYSFVLIIFFLYSYPIARLTVRLERCFAVKL